MTLPCRKKLIEVGLPLVAINTESDREKSIRHGHCRPIPLGLNTKVGRVRFSFDVSRLPPAEVVNAFLAEHAPLLGRSRFGKCAFDDIRPIVHMPAPAHRPTTEVALLRQSRPDDAAAVCRLAWSFELSRRFRNRAMPAQKTLECVRTTG